ncbi:17264_t:CDS:2, partial [Dentiscutata heterogama]
MNINMESILFDPDLAELLKKRIARFDKADKASNNESLEEKYDQKLVENFGECPRCKRENSAKNWCRPCAKDIYFSQLPEDIFGHLIHSKREMHFDHMVSAVNHISEIFQNIRPNSFKNENYYVHCNKCGKNVRIGIRKLEKKDDKEFCSADCMNKYYMEDKMENKYFNALFTGDGMSLGVESFIEYIPEERLQNKKFMSMGGFANIYTAEWMDGQIESIDFNKSSIKRKGPQLVVLKTIPDDIVGFDEAFRQFALNTYNICARSFGISYFKSLKQAFLVMKLYEEDARSLIARDYWKLLWSQRLKFLCSLIFELAGLHNEGIIHGDLHTKNILHDDDKLIIADFGLSPFDQNLALDICLGLRPEIPKDTPSSYAKLMTQCWDSNPDKRPIAYEILTNISRLLHILNDFLRIIKETKKKIQILGETKKKFESVNDLFKELLSKPEISDKFEVQDFLDDDIFRMTRPPPENIIQNPEESIFSKEFNYSDFIKQNLNSDS